MIPDPNKSNNDPFIKIITSIAGELEQVNQTIVASAKGKADLIAEITNHLVLSGGKRVRPILTILAAKLCGYADGKRHCNLAAAVELIHTATLLHDDVVDGSNLRRGKKTANAIWDNKASILVGDYLFSIAFQLMVRTSNLAVLDLLAKASSTMADGEVMQLENSSDVALTQEKYLEIIFGKTAVLFSAACESGALINKRCDAEISALRDFGKNLGIIFQIVDDVLDYSSQERVLGKEIGNDFFEGKVTLPIILTYKKASDTEQKFISEIFTKRLLTAEKNQNDFAEILALIEKHGGLADSKSLASNYRHLALSNLEIFPDSSFKSDLIEILDYSLARIS